MRKAFILLALLHGTSLYAQTDIEGGKTIFLSRCASCHSIKDRVVGPALKDVDKRHTSKWITQFVHSSQTLIKNGDANAIKLFDDNNQVVMPDHADLKDNDIENILAYIEDESARITNTANAQPFARPTERKENNLPLSENDYMVFIMWGIFISLLLFALYAIINGLDSMNNFHNDKI